MTDEAETDVVELARAMRADIDAAATALPVSQLINRDISGPYVCGESRRAPTARTRATMTVGGVLDSHAGGTEAVLDLAARTLEGLGLEVSGGAPTEGPLHQLDAVDPARRYLIRVVVVGDAELISLEGDTVCGPLPDGVETVTELRRPFAEMVDPGGDRFLGGTREDT